MSEPVLVLGVLLSRTVIVSSRLGSLHTNSYPFLKNNCWFMCLGVRYDFYCDMLSNCLPLIVLMPIEILEAYCVYVFLSLLFPILILFAVRL